MNQFRISCALAGAILSFTSCNREDPQTVARFEQQKTELVRLKGEIAVLEEKIAALPADVSAELESAKSKEAAQKAEIVRLETEIAVMETRRKTLTNETEAYRLKYSTR